MPIPNKVLVAGLVISAAAIRSLKRRDEQHNRNIESLEAHPKGMVHAFVSSPPSEQQQEPIVIQQRNGPHQASTALLLVSTALIVGAACVCALREQLDVAAALALAWLLVLLSQVGYPTALFNSKGQPGDDEADAEMVVEDVQPVKQLPDLNGTWIKDAAASDSMDAAMKLIHLNGMMRTAVRLIKGVDIAIDEQRFDFNVFSVISWFKVKERWSMQGEVCQNRRRDLRRGGCTGTVRVTPWGTLRLDYAWNAPHSGRGVDEFSIDDQGRLVIACTITVAGESASYKLVYHKK